MTTTGLRPRLNVRQRKDTGYLPHSSPFSLQFRPAILYSDGYLPQVPEDKNETDKIHTPRIVPQNWSARHLTPVALAVATVFMLAGCEKSDETVSLYQNADDCSAANPCKSAECTTAYNNALKEAERTAPKYATREDCVAEFGEGQCQQAPAQLAWHQKTVRRPSNPAGVSGCR